MSAPETRLWLRPLQQLAPAFLHRAPSVCRAKYQGRYWAVQIKKTTQFTLSITRREEDFRISLQVHLALEALQMVRVMQPTESVKARHAAARPLATENEL